MAIESNTPYVVAVGSSAGGVGALTNYAAGLPPDLPGPVLVALRMLAGAPSDLARILDRGGGSLRTATAPRSMAVTCDAAERH